MLASKILGRLVVTDDTALGIVHDLRVDIEGDDPLRIAAIVVGPDTARARLAFGWGYAEGRATGPAPLRRFLGRTEFQTFRASSVTSWDDGGALRLDDAEPDEREPR